MADLPEKIEIVVRYNPDGSIKEVKEPWKDGDISRLVMEEHAEVFTKMLSTRP